MSENGKKKYPKKWKCGAPEHGGHSASKLVIRYGKGSSHNATYPYFSRDWKSRNAAYRDDELGIRRLKYIVTQHLSKGLDVMYACIYDAAYMGKPLLHFTPAKGWLNDKDWQIGRGDKIVAPPKYRAWIGFTELGRYYRRMAGEKYPNKVIWSQENNCGLMANDAKRYGIQTLINQLSTMGTWQDYITKVVIYDNANNANLKLGSIELDARNHWRAVATSSELRTVLEEMKILNEAAMEFD